MKYFNIVMLLVVIVFAACEGPIGPQGAAGENGANGEVGAQGDPGPQGDPGSSDRQIRLEFDFFGGSSTNSTSDRILGPNRYIVNFDIRNYVDVDSVVVVTLLDSNNPAVQAISSLYNATDTLKIAGSDMISSAGTSEWVQSGNILSSLPQREVDLTLSIRTTNSSEFVAVSRGVLLIYRSGE
ncbi:MAG: collagen-like triple helix repeat-containing protein [Calditrichia bacterium]